MARRLLDKILKPVHQYHYQPLSAPAHEIRVLVLEPGSGRQSLRCALQPVPRAGESPPDYETTSYVWGNASWTGQVYVDDMILDIPVSAQKVLFRARLPDRPRTVDRCNMYQPEGQRGTYVEKHEAASLVANVDAIVTDLARSTDSYRKLSEMLFDPHNNWKHTSTGSKLSLDRQVLLDLFTCEWFSRLWVVQEVALAPQNICIYGEARISFIDILRAIAWFSLNFRTERWFPTSPYVNFARLEFMLRWAGADRIYALDPNIRVKSIHILESMRFFNATDPRDYVFGTLGVHDKLSDTVPSMLTPDYSVSYVEIYERAALAAITSDKSLAGLGMAGYRSGQVDELPSWVPRFNKPINKAHDPNPLSPLGTSADGGTPLQLHNTGKANGILIVSGLLLPGPVSQVVPSLRQESSLHNFITFISSSLSIAHELSLSTQPNPTTADIETDIAVATTFQAGVHLDGTRAASDPPKASSASNTSSHTSQQTANSPGTQTPTLSQCNTTVP
ncbi:hypothetical protein CBER1_09300 [Cercospora berteroae]|uniref:Uncharacterized protein n=1 Tax=Cercospora berteroae TaxID=357750 RepID=A0A2S6BWY0_9PEZI|nr:hypothetical protein CBER1_09300 [Cercospora berteroae]